MLEEAVKRKCFHLLSVSCVLILAPVHFFLLAWKFFVMVLAFIIWEEKATMMSGVDAVFAVQPNSSRKNCAVLSWIILAPGPISLDKLRRRVRETLVEAGQSVKHYTYRRFRQRVTNFLGFYFWRDADVKFDITRHVDYLRDTSENIPESDKGMVVRYASREDLPAIATTICDEKPFDMKVPPWNVYLVPKSDDSEAVVFFRFHHSMMDATGLSVMLSALFRDKRVANKHGSLKELTWSARVYKYGAALFDVPKFLVNQLFRPHDNNPLHAPKRLAYGDAGRWIYWGENYPSELLRDFRKRLNATLNDVALTAISRGLHRYMDFITRTDSSRHWTFSVTQPVSMWTKGSTTIGNRISFVTSAVPFTHRTHPWTQLEETRSKMESMLRSSYPWASFLALRLAYNTYPKSVVEFLTSSVSETATAACTNALYSPDMPEWIEDVGVIAPLPRGQAVGFAICTAMNRMKLTIFADKSVFPTMEDVILLERFVREEFLRLQSMSLTEWTSYLRRSRHGSRADLAEPSHQYQHPDSTMLQDMDGQS